MKPTWGLYVVIFKLSGKPEKLQEGNTAVDWHLIYGVEATLLGVSWRDKFWKIGYVADITDFKLLQIILSVPGGGGGDSHMEQTGMLVGNFEFNP